MSVGTCYYPEHWGEALWAEDLDRMLSSGVRTIRIAEFAWSIFEPEEGSFSFDFFDRFLKLCEEKGMRVIIGTPTATPPAWLTEKYPEALNGRIDGTLFRHGGRRHYNYNSPKYRELCSRVVEKMAEHYAKSPVVIGWQIDNELNCEVNEFYSEADSNAFRAYLKKKFGTLDALNQALGTVFWNQTYSDWSQLYIPRVNAINSYNPHLQLEYFRFISESAISFCRMQAEIIRKYLKPGDFITTNGMFGKLDNHRMTDECLDVYTYDSYPSFAFGLTPEIVSDLGDRAWSKNLTEVRSICPHFGIMEQQSGANGWNSRMEGPAPRPGQLTLWAMQSVAHGADYVSFFRWRTSIIGTEIYWHGILDYDNRENRKLREVKEFAQKMEKLQPLCGAEYRSSFALLKDHDNEWDAELDVWHQRISGSSEYEIFAASELSHTPYEIVYLDEGCEAADLAAWPVVFYPHPMILTQERVDLLEAYVENGGTLILGCRSGLKDENGKCVMLPQPGLLQSLTGTDIHDFSFTSPAEEATWADWNGRRLETPVFNDVITPLDDTEVLAHYGNSYYSGEAALTERMVGKGRVLHLGSAFSRQNVVELLKYTRVAEPFASLIEAPEELELVMREKDGKRYLFVLNYQPQQVGCKVKAPMRSLFSGDPAEGWYYLPPFGVEVFAIL